MPTLRTPQNAPQRFGGDAADAVLRREIMGEQAESLGCMGRKVEAALAALRSHEGEGRAEVLKAAAELVWGYLVQREILGLRDRASIIAQYDIPGEVLARLGAR